jgi:hypothetical protein
VSALSGGRLGEALPKVPLVPVSVAMLLLAAEVMR